jgi:phospholipid/cholesterol/gamma-HCH transport system substrate-binding protein
MTRNRMVAVAAVVLAGLIVAAAVFIVRETFFRPKTITAYFTTATGIYPGDGVRVSGVKVGTIAAIRPAGGHAEMTLNVDRDVPIPADAKAVIVAQNLISARYVELAPAYESSGPTMPDGARIPVERTAVPVEWDEVKTQLTRLATDLGPKSGVSGTSVSRFIDSAANALQGNGDKLRQTLAQLSGVGRILADGSGNIVDIIKNLQTFVTALRDSNEQIVAFGDRFATLTSVVNDNRSDLDAALNDLSVAVGEVQRFVAGSRDQTAEQVARLANVTQNLVDHKIDLENILHVAPNAIAGAYNIYNPSSGTPVGAFVFNNFSNPVAFICGAIGAIENATAPETAKLCAQYLGPALRLLNFNYLPIPTNPYLSKSPSPENLIYSEPNLAPDGAGPKPGPAEIPPAVSAYTGLNGDVPPPAGYGQPPAVAPGPSAPDHLPASPSPALYPGAPVPAPTSLPGMLLPAEAAPAPPAPAGPQPAGPAPVAGTPQS